MTLNEARELCSVDEGTDGAVGFRCGTKQLALFEALDPSVRCTREFLKKGNCDQGCSKNGPPKDHEGRMATMARTYPGGLAQRTFVFVARPNEAYVVISRIDGELRAAYATRVSLTLEAVRRANPYLSFPSIRGSEVHNSPAMWEAREIVQRATQTHAWAQEQQTAAPATAVARR